MNKNEDLFGCLLKKYVFIELKRRGYDVFYHADKKECDFVVREGMRIMKVYQVTIVMNDEKTRKREIEGLMEAMNAYGLAEGYILTMEEKEELEIDGKQVHVLPTWEWMLREVKYYKKSDHHTPKGNWYGILSRFGIKSPSGIASQKQ